MRHAGGPFLERPASSFSVAPGRDLHLPGRFYPVKITQASGKLLNFGGWFVAAEDGGIACSKLVETRRLPPENRWDDGRNL